MLDPRRPHWRPFGEPPHQLIQELFGADLKLERVSAVFDANVEQLYMQSRNVLASGFPLYPDRYPSLCILRRYDEPTASANNDTF